LEISNKTNQILNEIGIDYEQHVIKSFEKCKEKKNTILKNKLKIYWTKGKNALIT